jgi:hypothetical protein
VGRMRVLSVCNPRKKSRVWGCSVARDPNPDGRGERRLEELLGIPPDPPGETAPERLDGARGLGFERFRLSWPSDSDVVFPLSR